MKNMQIYLRKQAECAKLFSRRV